MSESTFPGTLCWGFWRGWRQNFINYWPTPRVGRHQWVRSKRRGTVGWKGFRFGDEGVVPLVIHSGVYKPTVHSPRAVSFHEESAGGARPHLPVTGVLHFAFLQVIVIYLPVVDLSIIILFLLLLGSFCGFFFFHTLNIRLLFLSRSPFSLFLLLLGPSLLSFLLLGSRSWFLRDLLIIV